MISKCKIKTLIFSYIIYNVTNNYKIFTKIKGLGYNGISLNIQSIVVIFIFSLFPSEKIKNEFTKKLLILATNHTAGVYYLHFSVNQFFYNYLDDIKKGLFLV